MQSDDDELDWDEWMEMSDAQQEAILERELKQLTDRINAMTPAQWYRYQRGSILRSITKARRFLTRSDIARIEIIDEMHRGWLAKNRIHLVKLRVFRSTGIYPGEA